MQLIHSSLNSIKIHKSDVSRLLWWSMFDVLEYKAKFFIEIRCAFKADLLHKTNINSYDIEPIGSEHQVPQNLWAT